MKLTEEQKGVLESPDSKLVVTAAAGAGKTLVLVERHFRHVTVDGFSPDQILTITFTKKAAAEMKSRIVERLRAAGRNDDAQIAETGPIQTIHGFCERLLRENAIEAGLDPEFGVMGDGESARLLDRCIKTAITQTENPFADELLHRLAGKRTKTRDEALEASVAKLFRSAREGGLRRLDFLGAHEDPAAVLGRWRSILLAECPPDVNPDLSGESFAGSVAAAYRAVSRAAPPYVRVRTSNEDDLRAASQTCGLAAMACEAWRLYESEIEGRQELDFTDLEARATRLLEDSAAVSSRLAAAYKVVMIDEGQDVNPIQHRLIDGIKTDMHLMVGDERQSIYGWRQADHRLFQSRARVYEGKALTENHRSAPGIVNFVNELFRGLWPDNEPMVKRDADVRTFEGVEIWEQRDEDATSVAAAIKEMVESGTKQGDIAVLVRASGFAIKMQDRLRAVGVASRIAGGTERFFVRMEIRDLANALRALVDHADDFSLLATLRSPFASLSLDSIALLALRSPVHEALEEFTPPLDSDVEALQRFKDWFLPLSRYADRLPAWEAVAEIFARSGYLEAAAGTPGAAQQLANVRKLLWLATEQPELGPAEFSEQIREIQELNHREGDALVEEQDADLVTLMTIHKAKGLEFPVVVVPNVHRALEGRRQTVEVDPHIPMAVTCFESAATPYFSYLAERRYAREKEEEVRLLYVALTRAKERLCVVAHPNTRKDTLAQRVAKNLDMVSAVKRGLKVKDLTPPV